MKLVARRQYLVSELLPPEQTMRQITVEVSGGCVQYGILAKKLEKLKDRGLMDAGLVLVQNGGLLVGYLAEGELEYGLNVLGGDAAESTRVLVLGPHSGIGHADEVCSGSSSPSDAEVGRGIGRRYGVQGDEELDLSAFVDRTPLAICGEAPMEYAVEMFGKLGLRYLIVTEQGSGRVIGVIIKKRMVSWLDALKDEE